MTTLPQPKKKRFYSRWWFWVLCVVGLLVIGITTAVMKGSGTAATSANAYLQEAVTVERRDVRSTISANGVIMPDQSTVLSVGLSGRVDSLSVAVGDSVSKDDLLLTTDASGPASATEISAPYDGRVVAVNTFEGDFVTPGTPLITLAYHSTHIEFLASEQEVIQLKPGQEVTITLPAYQNGRDQYTGEVTFVDVKKQLPSATSTDSGYVVKVSTGTLPKEFSTRLGLTVDMTILSEEKKNVLSLESGAVEFNDDGSAYVYELPELTPEFLASVSSAEHVVDVLTQRPISVGFEGDEYVELLSGVEEGDKVLLYIPQGASSGFPF